MNQNELMEALDETGEAQLLEPRNVYDPCIVGVGYRFHDGPVAIYSITMILKVLQDSGMDPEEAGESFQVNTLGAWMGDGTPFFVELRDDNSV